MTRFLLIIAFICCAGNAFAQSPRPGSTLPRDEASTEMLPLVILLSDVPTWRLVEAAGVGVGAYFVVDHIRHGRSESEYGFQSSPAGTATHYRAAGSRKGHSRRGTLIHRYF